MKALGTVDTSFLIAESRMMPMHTGGLMLFSYPEGAHEAHEDWLHETLSGNDDPKAVQYPFNQKVVWPLRRLGLPHWVTDDHLDTHYHVRHSALPKPGRYREMFSLVSRLHSTRLHRDRPLWEAHIIEGVEDNRFALYMKTHHSMIDGVGAMRMLRACLSSDPDERDMPAPWNMPRPRGQQNGSPDARGAVAATAGAMGGVLKFAAAVRHRDKHGMIAPFQTPLTILNGRVTGSRRLVAQSWSLPRVKKVAKALNATINDVVLAMSGGALRRYLIDQGALPDQPLTAMTPVSFRPADADIEGNSFSVVFASLATELGDPLDRLRAIQNSMGEAKRLLKGMNAADIPIFTTIVALPVLLPHLLRVSGRTRPTFNVTVSNVPGPREQLYWNGAPLEGMYPLSIVTHGQALNITVTSCGDSLDFGIVACRRSVPSAQRLIDHLDEALVELERSVTVG
jgi:diacylglycerol O-acyltransferase